MAQRWRRVPPEPTPRERVGIGSVEEKGDGPLRKVKGRWWWRSRSKVKGVSEEGT